MSEIWPDRNGVFEIALAPLPRVITYGVVLTSLHVLARAPARRRQQRARLLRSAF